MSHDPQDHLLDFARQARIGLAEAVFCAGKSAPQIDAILRQYRNRRLPVLLTRLEAAKVVDLDPELRADLDYDPLGRTAYYLRPPPIRAGIRVAIVSGGTSDAPVCAECRRTLAFAGEDCTLIQDVGVTGLWRLLERIDELQRLPVVIAVAGMEGALFSVLGGLIGAALIAVPTSVGYGVTDQGQVSLHAALGSCAPGILAVNIDNGYGAASAALRLLHQLDRAARPEAQPEAS